LLDSNNAAAWNNKGSALAKQGKYDGAIECYNESIRIDSNEPVYRSNKRKAFFSSMNNANYIDLMKKGKDCYNQKRFEEAIWCYDEIIKLDPKDFSALREKSEALNAQGKYDDARICYAAFWNIKGNSYSKCGDHGDALKCYDEALKNDPHNDTYKANRQNAFIVTIKGNINNLNSWMDKGNEFLSQKKYNEAILCYDEAIRSDPKNPSIWNNRGNSFFALGRYDEAIRCYAESNRIEPNYAEAWNNKGSAFAKLGRDNEAVICFNAAIKVDPKNRVYRNNKRKAFISAEKIGAINEKTWLEKGKAFLHQGKYDETIWCCEEALYKFNLKNTIAWSYKAKALIGQKNYDQAIKCYNEILKIEPKCLEIWNDMGDALINLGRYHEAIECFNRIIKFDPASPNLPQQLSIRLKGKPELAKAWNGKGKALNMLGKESEAVTAFSKARKLGYIS
jgi:tetratricopeptide (TPR) repeat protein